MDLEEIHAKLLEPDHLEHESLIRELQRMKDPRSIPVLLLAIVQKPQLRYLDYDDYGAYYKKCLWALRDIGTSEALAAIYDLTSSLDPVLKAQAEYRWSKLLKETP